MSKLHIDIVPFVWYLLPYMKTILTITDFRNNISEYMNQVVYRDKSFILKKRGRKIARIIPFTEKAWRDDKKVITSLLKAREELFRDKAYFKNAPPTLSRDIDKILYEKK